MLSLYCESALRFIHDDCLRTFQKAAAATKAKDARKEAAKKAKEAAKKGTKGATGIDAKVEEADAATANATSVRALDVKTYKPMKYLQLCMVQIFRRDGGGQIS